jgi:hypothetical protein
MSLHQGFVGKNFPRFANRYNLPIVHQDGFVAKEQGSIEVMGCDNLCDLKSSEQ